MVKNFVHSREVKGRMLSRHRGTGTCVVLCVVEGYLTETNHLRESCHKKDNRINEYLSLDTCIISG